MASVRKLDPSDPKSLWVCEYTDPGSGKRIRKTPKSGLWKDADAIRKKVEAEIEAGAHTPSSATITVKEACDRFLSRCRQRMIEGERMTRNTYEQRSSCVRNHIVPFIGHRKLTELTGPVVQQWVDDLKAKGRKSTSLLKTTVSVLRLAISDAQRYGLVGRNIVKELPPDLGAKREKLIEIPSKRSVELILAAAAPASRERLVIELALFTGMRIGEILGLTWGAIDFSKKLITVRHSANKWKEIGAPKTHKGYRELPVPPRLMGRLEALRTERDLDRDPVIQTGKGRVMSQTEWQVWFWPKVLRKAGLNDKGGSRLVTHSLRHFAASLFIDAGLLPKRVQYLMGHASIQMTFDRYGHLFPDGGESARVVEGIEAAFGSDENATLAA